MRMRRIVIAFTLAGALAIVTLFSACSLTTSGGTVTETEEFSGFSSVDVENIFKVEIVQSGSFNITITADRNFIDYLAVSQEGEVLKVYLSPHHPFTDFTSSGRVLEVKIAMPALYDLRLSGASKGTISRFKSSHDFVLNLSGVSSLNMEDIETGDINVKMSGASKISGNLKAGDVELEVSGASQVELDGSANGIVLDASGADKVDLTDFLLSTASVNLSGASQANIDAKDKLDCTLSDASSLYFYGNPVIGDVSVSGASTIKHKYK